MTIYIPERYIKPKSERQILTLADINMISQKELEEIDRIMNLVNLKRNSQGKIEPKDYDAIQQLLLTELSSPNFTLNSIKTEIIIATIHLHDATKIADALTKQGFHRDDLKNLIRTNGKIKNSASKPESINADELTTFEATLKTIFGIFEKEFGIIDETIILNRLTEIVTRFPHYFRDIPNKGHSRQKIQQ